MNPEQIRAIVLQKLAAIAPEAELATLDPEADVREALDLDSMDILRFATALHDALGVEIPEPAYAQLTSVRKCVDYLCAASTQRL
jgi:acyl carrier protein